MSTIPQRDLYRMINEAAERGERVVVATVAHTRGSTPQQRGAKMLFFQDGKSDEAVATVNLQRLEARPCELEAKLRDLPPGCALAWRR